MAINNIGGPSSSQVHSLNEYRVQEQGNQTPAQTNQPAPAQAPAGGDSVSLTNTAAQLRALEQQLASVPVVDSQRVNSIKEDISAGTFSIDPPRVADKMIQIEGMISAK